MKRSLLTVLIIMAIVLISGCLAQFDGDEQVVRTYTHNASSNVTINIYKETNHNLTIVKYNSTNITVVESFYLKKSYVINNKSFIIDYVKFNGNDTDLTLNISSLSPLSASATKDAKVQINISLPTNTNYTINYVDASYFKGG